MLWILIISFVLLALFLGNPIKKKRDFGDDLKRKKNRKRFK
tara:strand:- start:519 stop:641 length:123 start_codon:yes stop_codon:yes gene_type:complete